ncbi:uncharacterized protein LOC117219213 [Megalopta genalis]|uniref:uncharacterized protein LOC117219213 n=1 Tax=Megalopta genalis TaxID=115081 RepID=UPI003FD56122
MSVAFRTVLHMSVMFSLAVCEFPNTCTRSNNYSVVYSILEKWANTTKTALLTVVFDDYDDEDTSDDPRGILNYVKVPSRLITLDHMMSLSWQHQEEDYRVVEPGGCVLLQFSQLNRLKNILDSPHLSSFWHPDSFYVLQSLGTINFCKLERFCRWLFQRLWRTRRIYKIIFLASDSSRTIRFDPFGRVPQEGYFLKIDYTNLTDVSDLFEERRSFEKHPLRISIFESTTMTKQGDQYGGLDYRYLEGITKKMNVTPILVQEKDKHGWKENNVFFGTLGQLVYGHCDVSFNQFFVKDYMTKQIEFTAAINSDRLCVVVPKALPIPEYLEILKTFSGGCWLLILTSYFVIAIIYTSIKDASIANRAADSRQSCEKVRGSREYCSDPRYLADQSGTANEIAGKRHGRPYDGFSAASHPSRLEGAIFPRLMILVKYFTEIMLHQTQPFENTKPWFPERLFVMCSLWLSLILNGVFASQLAASFSRLHYYDDIDTLEQLEQSGLEILTSSRDIIDDALTDATSPILKRLHDRMMYANETEIKRRLFQSRDAAHLYQLTLLPFKYDKHQRRKLHIVKECPKDYILANIVREGSPFRDRINSILSRLNNAGFYGKWYRDHIVSRLASQQNRKDESIVHRKITVRHLLIPFAIFHFGLAVSTIVFIYERRDTNRVAASTKRKQIRD